MLQSPHASEPNTLTSSAKWHWNSYETTYPSGFILQSIVITEHGLCPCMNLGVSVFVSLYVSLVNRFQFYFRRPLPRNSDQEPVQSLDLFSWNFYLYLKAPGAVICQYKSYFFCCTLSYKIKPIFNLGSHVPNLRISSQD